MQRTFAVRVVGSSVPLTQSTFPSNTLSGYATTVTLDRRADVHAREVHLEHVGDHPDRVELADGEELLRAARRSTAPAPRCRG